MKFFFIFDICQFSLSTLEPTQMEGISAAAENRITTLEKENSRLRKEIETMLQRNGATSPRVCSILLPP
jgi:hypothetical protein